MSNPDITHDKYSETNFEVKVLDHILTTYHFN